jgi:hypothetical protein
MQPICFATPVLTKKRHPQCCVHDLDVSVRKPGIEIARNFVDDVEKFNGVSVNRERFTNPLSATS